MLGFTLAGGGHYLRALDAANLAVDVGTEIQHRQWLASAHCALGAIYHDLHAHHQAMEHLERAIWYASDVASLHWINTTTGFLATHFVSRGELDRAETLLNPILGPDTPMQTIGQRQLWCARMELLLARGCPDQILNLIERMESESPNRGPANPILRLSLLRGRTFTALGRLDEAESAFKEALGLAE